MPERKISYHGLEKTTESGFKIAAPSLQRLYIDAGLALTDQMLSLDLIKDSEKHTLNIDGENKEALMLNWLNSVLSLYEKNQFLCKRIVFNQFDVRKLQASVWGESYVSTRHGYLKPIITLKMNQLDMGMGTDPESLFYLRIKF